MLLRAVVDIDPGNPLVQDLSDLAFSYGLIDMTEVLTISIECVMTSMATITHPITEVSFTKVIQALLACAIVNLANWKYEKVEIEIATKTIERMAFPIFRKYPLEMHRELGNKYFDKAKELIRNHLPAI